MSAVATSRTASPSRRAYWLKTLHQWHWVSGALCLIGMLLFAATGITLNHAHQIPSTPEIIRLKSELPAPLRAALAEGPAQGTAALPTEVADWLRAEWSVAAAWREAEWSEDEVYLSLPRPGGDAWLNIDRATGAAEYERTDRGWIAYLNDLHKGRNAGAVWSAFLDVFSVACLVFSLSGLWLLKLHGRQRGMTWPTVGLGVLAPLLLALLFIH